MVATLTGKVAVVFGTMKQATTTESLQDLGNRHAATPSSSATSSSSSPGRNYESPSEDGERAEDGERVAYCKRSKNLKAGQNKEKEGRRKISSSSDDLYYAARMKHSVRLER